VNKLLLIITLLLIGCVSQSTLQCDELYQSDYNCPVEPRNFNWYSSSPYTNPVFVPNNPYRYYNPYFYTNNCSSIITPPQIENQRPIITGPRPSITSPRSTNPKSDN